MSPAYVGASVSLCAILLLDLLVLFCPWLFTTESLPAAEKVESTTTHIAYLVQPSLSAAAQSCRERGGPVVTHMVSGTEFPWPDRRRLISDLSFTNIMVRA